MADADEDAIPRNGSSAQDVDLSDEVQDFRFLASVSREDAKIPKRGEKDFEPHKTNKQANVLDASRQAMHDALSFQRVHLPKKANVAVYHPQTNKAYIDAPRSTLFKSIGTVLSPRDDPMTQVNSNTNRVWLLPEEILYLIDRGTVDCRWPATDEDGDALGLPMTLQAAYAIFLGLSDEYGDGLTFNRYSVYSYLKRAGYAVHRAPSWNAPEEKLHPNNFAPLPGTWAQLGLGVQSWRKRFAWFGSDGNSEAWHRQGPLAQGRIYRSYPDIYRSLALIPWYDPTTRDHSETSPRHQDLRVVYHAWKPSNQMYKKSKPPPPDFQIAITDARLTDLPTLAELGGLMDTMPYAPPGDGLQLYPKLKHGYKSVILAVVDQGVTSMLRLSDMASGREPLYNRGFRPGKKKGGGRPQNRKR